MMPGDGEIVAAATRWARGRFAAPRKFERLITGVDVRDEIIERVATCIERRDLREERVATGERRLTRPRVDLDAIDPFAYTAEALKADSEHVSHCTSCGASGRMMCPPCRGTGNGRCPTCHGSGKQTSEKTGRPIQCKSCRATGSAPCRICAGAGSIHCSACLGSGHQLTWLTIASREHWSLYVPEHSSFVIAHPALRAPRAVQRQELSDATLLGEHSATCPLDVHALPEADRALVAAQLAPIDLRFERVRFQQYVKLAALRRDVTYEMCGTRATLSLSGNSLTPATTPAALRPIRRRLWLWIALCFAVACVGELAGKAMLGASPYYQDAIGSVSALACVALVASIPLFGTLLRAWRGGLQFGPVRRLTAVWAAGTVGALIAIPIVAFAARPSVAEIDAALVRHDLPRARAVLDAYKEVAAVRGDLAGAQDRVARAEAEQRRGQALDRAQQLLAAHQPREALAALDRDFAGDRAPEVAEARARAHDGLAADCTTPACRLDEARQANAAQPTARADRRVPGYGEGPAAGRPGGHFGRGFQPHGRSGSH
ncbi:MAG TPA: hypothetical protein VFP84_08715, partial [Kofleriaceae bacterium]|nr:hypothetical protein [Kofleriaceae bacterium]